MIISGYIESVDTLWDRDRGTCKVVVLREGKRFGNSIKLLMTEEEYKEIDPTCSHCGHLDHKQSVEIHIKKGKKI